MLSAAQIVGAAIPGISEEDARDILWSRTSFPFGNVTARDLYRAASRAARAHRSGIELCDLCDNKGEPGERWACTSCRKALQRIKDGAG